MWPFGKRRDDERVVEFKNRGQIEEFMGDTQPYLAEVLAVRIFLFLQGERFPRNGETNTTLDWTHEGCAVTWIRDCGPGLRTSTTVVGLYMLVLQYFFDVHLFFKYDTYIEGFSMLPANITIGTTLFLWSFDICFSSLGFFLLNAARGDLRLSVYSTKAIRNTMEDGNACVRLVQAVAWVWYAVLFAFVFVLGTFTMHTIIVQMYVRENIFFAMLFGLLTLTTLVTALADICAVGSPWGLGASSREASQLLSFRAVVVVPILVWFSICTVFASFPPSFCEEC